MTGVVCVSMGCSLLKIATLHRGIDRKVQRKSESHMAIMQFWISLLLLWVVTSTLVSSEKAHARLLMSIYETQTDD